MLRRWMVIIQITNSFNPIITYIKKHFRNVLRWGLRLHGLGHLIEVFSAIAEQAYITATIALIFISIEI